jgi:hypothetical protein
MPECPDCEVWRGTVAGLCAHLSLDHEYSEAEAREAIDGE